MDLIKQLIGKSPNEYEKVAKALVDNADEGLFSSLVKQDDFIFPFIKENVANRIRHACSKENYLNLLKFLKYYSSSYDTMIAEVLHTYSGDDLFQVMKELYDNGTENEKAYAVKYFSFIDNKDILNPLMEKLRVSAYSDFEPLALNSAEVLSICKDEFSKTDALMKLDSDDEFSQYSAVKFLINYQAKDALDKIVEVMKTSGLSENIAIEIPYLVTLEELYAMDSDKCNLVLCYILDAIPEIAPLSCIVDYSLKELFEKMVLTELSSSDAVVLGKARTRFIELYQNDEYSYDCDKHTKDALKEICDFLRKQNLNKLKNLMYEELYEESDFVLFVVDLIREPEALVELLDSKNPTLVLKILTKLKEYNVLEDSYKETAVKNMVNQDIINIIKVL